MEFGVRLPHFGQSASPDAIRDVSQAAEGLGYDAVWTSDHVVLPKVARSAYTLEETPPTLPDGVLAQALSPFYEFLVTLTYVAGATQRIRLGASVCVLPLRNPVYNARQLATLDALSGGRLLLGVGSGWLREEAEALQMPWDQRGARTEEHIAVLRRLWTATEPYVSFEGRFYQFAEVAVEPRPAQEAIPILIGGHSPVAKERAARIGDGWNFLQLPLEERAHGVVEVRQMASSHGRDPDRLLFVGATTIDRGANGQPVALIGSLGALVGEPTRMASFDLPEQLRHHRDCGTTHIIFNCAGSSPEGITEIMRLVATEVLPEFRAA